MKRNIHKKQKNEVNMHELHGAFSLPSRGVGSPRGRPLALVPTHRPGSEPQAASLAVTFIDTERGPTWKDRAMAWAHRRAGRGKRRRGGLKGPAGERRFCCSAFFFSIYIYIYIGLSVSFGKRMQGENAGVMFFCGFPSV